MTWQKKRLRSKLVSNKIVSTFSDFFSKITDLYRYFDHNQYMRLIEKIDKSTHQQFFIRICKMNVRNENKYQKKFKSYK